MSPARRVQGAAERAELDEGGGDAGGGGGNGVDDGLHQPAPVLLVGFAVLDPHPDTDAPAPPHPQAHPRP
jgi:hypothetical protein